MGMAAALSASGHIVKVLDALDVKGNVIAALDEGQIAARIRDFGKANYLADINIEFH